MKAGRFNEEQMIRVLKENDGGVPVKELCRKHGISHYTFYRWKAKFGGMGISDARRLKVLEDENRKLKRIVADLTLDNTTPKRISRLASAEFVGPRNFHALRFDMRDDRSVTKG